MHHNFPSTLEWLDLQRKPNIWRRSENDHLNFAPPKKDKHFKLAIDASSDIPDLNLEKLYARWNKCNILKLISEQRK